VGVENLVLSFIRKTHLTTTRGEFGGLYINNVSFESSFHFRCPVPVTDLFLEEYSPIIVFLAY